MPMLGYGSFGNYNRSGGGGGGSTEGILDPYSPTLAISVARNLLTSWGTNSKYTTASGEVDSVKDQTGNGADFNNINLGVRPVIGTMGPNSRTCLDFDGSNDTLQCAVNMSNYLAAGDAFIVVSCMIDSISTDNVNPYFNQCIFGDNAGYIGLGLRTNSGSPICEGFNFNGSTWAKPNVSVATATPYVFTWRHNGGNIYISKNGGAESSAASGNTGGGSGDLAWKMSLGHAISNFFDGKIIEMACWNSGSTPDATGRADIISKMMTYSGAV